MKTEIECITIFGVGKIGFRYFQALLSIKHLKKIILVDPLILKFKETLLNTPNIDNKILSFFDDFDRSVLDSNLVIISSTSTFRLEICEKLIRNSYKSHILLEKFLFPDLDSLAIAKDLFKSYPSKIYVNQWLRKSPYRKIILENFKNNSISVTVEGKNWGLLCNSVHFIDLVFQIFKVDKIYFKAEKSYVSNIFESKRLGFQEMSGSIYFSNKEENIVLNMIDNDSFKSDFLLSIKIKNEEQLLNYFVKDNHLYDSNGLELMEFPFLSQHSADSVIKIINNQDPLIPSFEDSIEHHYLVLESIKLLVEKYNYKMPLIT